MQVNQSLSYANEHFEVVFQKPTLANCQKFLDYWRQQIAELTKLDKNNITELALASMPNFDELKERVELCLPYVVSLKNGNGELLNIQNLDGDAAQFLAAASGNLYSDCFALTDIKKK